MNPKDIVLPPPLPMHKETTLLYSPINRTSFESDSTFMSDDSDLNEHDFWQAHSSTMIISPTQNKPISLAAQVKRILGTVIQETDQAIEQEWDQSRQRLDQTLIHLPHIHL
ncbi:hypothetical protein A0J61_08507 [Choanephora cucurbitarum]|uniref:Uncharacterized protein n=1 Tax=Choanephora cucurbitarum TaxID=101091 RepID=A0A1C7N302_9FUNG|nr:hypothetical protein A0J61_08507 [Choanephora cucurbitarum]